MFLRLRQRLPELSSIVQVYAVIAVSFSAWTITAFLWRLSAWLLFLNLGEIFTIFSYAMLANFAESLLVLLLLVIAGALLPAEHLRDQFAVRGTILGLGIVGSLMTFLGFYMQFEMQNVVLLYLAPLVALALTLFVFRASFRSPAVQSAVLWLSDRLLVFLYLLLPLFVALSAYVLARNLK